MGQVRQILLLLTLFSLSASAASGLRDPAFLASLSKTNAAAASPSPSLVDASLRYWWVASDKPLGLKVTNWLDRVQSQVLTNSNDGTRPTNSASGIAFNRLSSYSLQFSPTPTPASVNINGTGVVYVIVTPTETASTFDSIISTDDTAGASLFTQDSGFTWGNNVAQTIFGPLTYGRTMDVMVVITNATAGGYGYTNGVFAKAFASNLGDLTGSLKSVGKDQNGAGHFYTGFIKEIIFYSNVLSTVSISNLHWYATNTYGFAP